ncbi:hypothetical protein AB205_0013790 [Aquarana catesbeiana]|uniref:Uncharacterized protein n=1 Tax=Aquarana catesbeiana TaxID=8400 RepID=A0A2G9S1Q6_AQUCT|nr:hypothetical protein AB205_0013790 [Aquarana catesbeiana]
MGYSSRVKIKRSTIAKCTFFFFFFFFFLFLFSSCANTFFSSFMQYKDSNSPGARYAIFAVPVFCLSFLPPT